MRIKIKGQAAAVDSRLFVSSFGVVISSVESSDLAALNPFQIADSDFVGGNCSVVVVVVCRTMGS
jgi:hypothetical protein